MRPWDRLGLCSILRFYAFLVPLSLFLSFVTFLFIFTIRRVFLFLMPFFLFLHHGFFSSFCCLCNLVSVLCLLLLDYLYFFLGKWLAYEFLDEFVLHSRPLFHTLTHSLPLSSCLYVSYRKWTTAKVEYSASIFQPLLAKANLVDFAWGKLHVSTW